MSEWCQIQKRDPGLGEIMRCLLQHFLKELRSLLEGLSGKYFLVIKKLHLIYTSEPLQNLHSGVSKPVKNHLTLCFSCEDV